MDKNNPEDNHPAEEIRRMIDRRGGVDEHMAFQFTMAFNGTTSAFWIGLWEKNYVKTKKDQA